jgi:hypothetical protein
LQLGDVITVLKIKRDTEMKTNRLNKMDEQNRK